MKDNSLREVIRDLLASHPDIAISAAGHAPHAERFVTSHGSPIGFEPERVRFQNLWVRADSVNAARLKDIESRTERHANFHISRPNHNLYGEPAFKDADLMCFKVRTAWEAARVIAEVAGLGSKT